MLSSFSLVGDKPFLGFRLGDLALECLELERPSLELFLVCLELDRPPRLLLLLRTLALLFLDLEDFRDLLSSSTRTASPIPCDRDPDAGGLRSISSSSSEDILSKQKQQWQEKRVL